MLCAGARAQARRPRLRLSAEGSAWGAAPGIALGVGVAAFAAAASIALGPLALALPAAGAIAYGLVRYPLVLYVAFLYVGLFKGHGLIESLPLDATLVLGAMLAAVCLHRFFEGSFRMPPLMLALPIVVIGVLMAISLVWTPEAGYGAEKTFKFLTLTALAAFAPCFLITDRDSLWRLLVVLGAAGVVGAVVVLMLGTTSGDEDGRLVFNDAANTIFTSRFLLTGAFVLLIGSALKLFGPHRTLLVALGAGVVVVAASIGSRGPVVAFVLALACTMAAILFREPRRTLPMLLLVMAGVAAIPLISLPETSSQRFDNLVSDPSGAFEQDLRSRLYEKGIELAEENPVRGVGVGGFFRYSYIVSNREERYPHNVFIETAAELGLAPALLLAASVLAMLALLYRRAWSAQVDARNLILLLAGVFLVNFFATQFSGDFNDNKTFWAMLGVGWLIAAHGVMPGEGNRGAERRQGDPASGAVG